MLLKDIQTFEILAVAKQVNYNLLVSEIICYDT